MAKENPIKNEQEQGKGSWEMETLIESIGYLRS